MPAAHTADRATRSQRGTDTRSRTGAAILAPSLRLSPRRAPGTAPPRARARFSLAGRARARAPHWPARRARHNPLPIPPALATPLTARAGRGASRRRHVRPGRGCGGGVAERLLAAAGSPAESPHSAAPAPPES